MDSPLFNFYFYARVSTKGQELKAQKLQAEQFCRGTRYRITKTFEDNCSAYSQVPTNMVAMIKEIAEMAPQHRPYIMVKNVDRFSRNFQYGTECIEAIISLGIEILFYDFPHMNVRTIEGREEFNRLLVEAENESKKISDRVRNSIAARKEAGLMTTARPPYGKMIDPMAEMMENDEERRKLTNCPEEMATLGLIAMMNGDYTPNQLMKAIRVFEDNFRLEYSRKTLYDDNFIDYNQKDEVFYGKDSIFAEILNYFGIYKRGEPWTRGTIYYQWNNVIWPEGDVWEEFIEENFLKEYVPDEALKPIQQVLIFDDSDIDSNDSFPSVSSLSS